MEASPAGQPGALACAQVPERLGGMLRHRAGSLDMRPARVLGCRDAWAKAALPLSAAVKEGVATAREAGGRKREMLVEIPTVTIERRALAALRCYLEAVPGEVSGIGLVADRGGRPHIAEVFILRQVSGWWETELNPGALAQFVAGFERRGGDPSQLRCWWHSHGDLEVSWSETDEATILAFPGEGLVSLVANRWGEVLCRLDRWGSGRETTRDVPLVVAGEPLTSLSLLALRATIRAEVAALVRPAAVAFSEDIGIPP